ncbi:MAG TPA: hypothetical protein DIW51_10425 [Rhodospirillaceae bacterium]|nr:hypothetical protein [Rhodospirillaceae bacterium]|tara:strand:+ start:147 stop:629 length:483 start_codon:yes stop_codon:yes gene_type:complete
MADKEPDDLDEPVPDPIDDEVRAELSLIYNKANDALLFVKAQQWWTVGSTLAVFMGLFVIAKLVGAKSGYVSALTGLIILMTCACVFMLVIYQFWQHNELARIQAVAGNFSATFQKIHAIKSSAEGNFHRYTLLAFMIALVILGAIVTYMGLDQLPRWPR